MSYRLRKNLTGISLILLAVVIYGTVGFLGFWLKEKTGDIKQFLSASIVVPKENIINIKVYAPADTEGLTESSINEFIDNINRMYKLSDIDVVFKEKEFNFYPKGTCPISSLGINNLTIYFTYTNICHFDSKSTQVVLNIEDVLNQDHKFSWRGLRTTVHELGHFLGVKDFYWLRVRSSPGPLSVPDEVKDDIMYFANDSSNIFDKYSKPFIVENIKRLINGQGIKNPADRFPSKLIILIKNGANKECNIFLNSHIPDIIEGQSSEIDSTPILTETADTYKADPSFG